MRLPLPIINDIITLDQSVSYNLRSGVTVTSRRKQTNFVLRMPVGFYQSSGDNYQANYKMQLVYIF